MRSIGDKVQESIGQKMVIGTLFSFSRNHVIGGLEILFRLNNEDGVVKLTRNQYFKK